MSESSYPRTSQLWLLAGLILITFVSAAAILAYHVSTLPSVIGGFLYAAVFATFVFWLLLTSSAEPFRKLLGSPVLWLILLLGMAVVDQRHYLKAHVRSDFPSSAEALERPAQLLIHGMEPYRFLVGGYPAEMNYNTGKNAPMSPGPGWVLLLSPLTAAHWTGVLASVVLAILLALMKRKGRIPAGLFLVILLAQPIFFFQAESGQDLYVVSMALVIVSLLAERITTDREALLLGVLTGLIATARMPVLLPIVVIGYGCFRKTKRTGAMFIIVSLLVALALHTGFALWAHHNGHIYQPMHVFHRGAGGAGAVSRISALLFLGLSLLWILRKMNDNAADWCLGSFLVMASLFIPEALKELTYTNGLNWEGSTYITFPVPLLIAAIVLRRHAATLQTAGS